MKMWVVSDAAYSLNFLCFLVIQFGFWQVVPIFTMHAKIEFLCVLCFTVLLAPLSI